jgi:hypothetical protein
MNATLALPCQVWYNKLAARVFASLAYGAYSVMVRTSLCGSGSMGSNPIRHPLVYYFYDYKNFRRCST